MWYYDIYVPGIILNHLLAGRYVDCSSAWSKHHLVRHFIALQCSMFICYLGAETDDTTSVPFGGCSLRDILNLHSICAGKKKQICCRSDIRHWSNRDKKNSMSNTETKATISKYCGRVPMHQDQHNQQDRNQYMCQAKTTRSTRWKPRQLCKCGMVPIHAPSCTCCCKIIWNSEISRNQNTQLFAHMGVAGHQDVPCTLQNFGQYDSPVVNVQ